MSCSNRLARVFVFLLSATFLGAAVADDRIAIHRLDAQPCALELYDPPSGLEGNPGEPLACYTGVASRLLDMAGGQVAATTGGELVVLGQKPGGMNRLSVYSLNAETEYVGPPTARDRRLGRGRERIAVGNFDDDPAAEVAVLGRGRNGSYQLLIRELRGRSRHHRGRVRARVREIGSGIVALSSGNFDGDAQDELVIVRDDGSLQVYDPPRAGFGRLGAPILGFADIGTDVISNGVVVGAFSGIDNALAVVRADRYGTHTLEIYEPPSTREDYFPQLIAGYADIGTDVVAIAAVAPGSGYGNDQNDADLLVDGQGSVPVPEGDEILSLIVPIPDQGARALLPEEEALLVLINQQRQAYGLPDLRVVEALGVAARRHSDDMAQNNFMSHTGSDGSTPWERMGDAGYRFYAAGENVAAGYPTPASVLTGWMNSPGHRANILNRDFCEMGTGYAYGSRSNYGHYWTLDLGCSR